MAEQERREPGAGSLAPKALVRRGHADPVAIAGIASVVWIVTVGAYAIGFFTGTATPETPRPTALSALLFLLGGIAPVALMLLGATVVSELRSLRAALAGGSSTKPISQETDDTARHVRQLTKQTGTILARLQAIEARLGERATEAPTPASVAAGKATKVPAKPKNDSQATLPLGEETAPPAARVPWSDIIRAIDFPRDASDTDGFEAVRSAIRDPETARLLQAAEDVLTILAGDGLHMEDFTPDHAGLGTWRAYAEGARGEAVAALAGIRDDEALVHIRRRLRADPVFRDAAMVFIQRWNGLVSRIVSELGEDPALRDAADTRSGRAFMMLGRAMGVFGMAG
jgi:hypothetical protein